MTRVTLYGIPNCDTVKRARAWLTDHGIDAAFHDFKKAGVPADQLDARVGELVAALTGASPNAVRECKKLLHDVAGRDITRLLIERTVEGIADIRASDEGKEGVQSFLQKRKPNWL